MEPNDQAPKTNPHKLRVLLLFVTMSGRSVRPRPAVTPAALMLPLPLLLLLLLAPLVPLPLLPRAVQAEARTIRYRPGRLEVEEEGRWAGSPGILERLDSATVADVRDRCRQAVSCVSFSYWSPLTRFPSGNVTAYLYPHADWMARSDGTPSFVDDPEWHTYVNVTREGNNVAEEVAFVLVQLLDHEGDLARAADGSGLRGGGDDGTGESLRERRLALLQTLFDIAMPREYKDLAAPLIARPVLSVATSDAEDTEVRHSAMRVLIALGDADNTGFDLLNAGVYPAMKRIVEEGRWGEGGDSELALDILSNICLHRSANQELRTLGAHVFLRQIVHDQDGFPGLQAALALTHIGDEDFDIGSLPRSMLGDLVRLLQNAIDGDIVYGIKWDLLPGPLSSIKYLVLHTRDASVHDGLLNAGLFEQLLRILEADTFNPTEVEVVMEILEALVTVSERARHMVMFAEHSLAEVEERLWHYSHAAELATDLVELAESLSADAAEL